MRDDYQNGSSTRRNKFEISNFLDTFHILEFEFLNFSAAL